MTLTDHTTLTADEARAIYRHADSDPQAYASITLLLLAGLRVREVEGLRIRDWQHDRNALRTGTARRPRTITICQTAADAIAAALAGETTDPDDCLLPKASTTRLVTLVRAAARQAGIDAGVHNLRQAAIAAAIEDGTPISHVQAYFGFTAGAPRETDPPLRDGWDAGVARSLEAAFT